MAVHKLVKEQVINIGGFNVLFSEDPDVLVGALRIREDKVQAFKDGLSGAKLIKGAYFDSVLRVDFNILKNTFKYNEETDSFINITSKYLPIESDFIKYPQVDFYTALITVFILVAAGTLAGFIPAYRAAKIKPIVALKDE